MSVCVVDNNTMMTTSASSTELNDTNSLSTKAGIPPVPKRPTIIRVDKQNVQENTDESKPRGVPKVPPRPPPPRPGPPPVPTKQPVVLKSSDSKKKKPEITIVNARPMSEVCFRDKKPEIPVPPRPQKPKDQGEISSVPSLSCTNVALPTEPSTDVRIKSSTLPPERPCFPPAAIIKRDPPKVPPQRPAPPKSTLSAPIKSTPPPRPPACIQTENSKPPSDPTDPSPHLPKELPTQPNSTNGSVTPPKPRPRTFFDSSSKPLKAQRSLSTYKPTKNEIPPRPLPRKHATSSTVDSDASKTSTVELFADVIPPPKPSRHQSFRNSSSPIPPSSRPCSSLSSQSQETSSASDPSIQSLPSAKFSTDDEETLEAILLSTEEAALDDKTDSSESIETPESFKVEHESSSTDKTTPCPLPPKKNSVVISQPSFKCSSEEDLPVPSPRIKRSPRPDVPVKPDTPASTPVTSDPVSTLCEEPKDFILPSAEDIVTIPKATVSKPTIIRVSTSRESLQEPNPTTDSLEKQPNLSTSSEKLPLEETTKNVHPKDSEVKRSHRPPPPIPKKSPISANVCDRNNSTKTVSRPSIPKKPPKPSPPVVAQMPVKSKENLLKESETKEDSSSNSSGSTKSIKSLFSKKSSSPSSSSTDLKKPSAAKSRKAAEMLQTTKDYTRRISKSLGFKAAEEPRSTVWYTDKTEEPDEIPIPEEKSPLIKKKENPSIWYVDEVPEEETEAEAETAPVPPQSASLTDKSKIPEKDRDEKVKEMDNSMCQPTEEPSPTEISAFQKYHSYMKRTIEQAVGIQLSKSSTSLIDEDINEKNEQEFDSIKPQPVKPPVPEPPKQRPPIPPKEARPPKPSAPPQVKPNVPAVPPKRPPVPASVTQPSTKPEGPVMRPPPPRPKPVVSVKPTVPDNQNITTNDSDFNSKNVIMSEKRSSSIENLIGKFEEELCKKSVPPPRPAAPVNKPKSVTNNLTDNEDQQLSSEIKKTPQSADAKTEITSMPSNINDGSSIQPDENENLSVSATEVGENAGGTENSQTSNLTGNSSIDENANEEAENEPGKLQDANAVDELETEEKSVTEAEQSHKVGYSDSFNQRCTSLMNDLKIRFESVEKDDTDSQIEEVVEPENVEKADTDNKIEPENVENDVTDSKSEEVVESVSQPLDKVDINPEKMQESISNEETGEKELEEKVETSSSEEKSSSHLPLEPHMTEEEKTSIDDSTSHLQSKVENDTESSEISQEVTTTQVIELDSKDAGPEKPPKSSSTSKLTGPRAIASFDFDAQAEDELTLKKDDTVRLLSWVDTSWLYGNCHGKTGIFPLAFVHVIEPLPQTPSDTNGNKEITDVSQESAMEDDANRVSNVDSKENSTLVMDGVYENLSEAKAGSAPESMKGTEATVISTKQEISEGVANTKDDAEEDELTDSDQLDKINIPVGGEETVAYAIYDFEGEDGELSFKEGDAITILKWINDDWLLGKKEELVGNLPANFVNFTGDSTDELSLVDTDGPPMPKEPPPTLQLDVKTDQLLTYVAAQLEHVKRLKGFACARFDFEARDDDELSFKDGDRIEIVEFVNDDWIRGSLHKKEGIFPAAFVSVEEYSPDEENPPSETTKVRALHDFTASANDELSFKAGALITCYGDVVDLPGWSNGSFEGKTGIFPSEFVTQEGV